MKLSLALLVCLSSQAWAAEKIAFDMTLISKAVISIFTSIKTEVDLYNSRLLAVETKINELRPQKACPQRIGSKRSFCSSVMPSGCYCTVRLRRSLEAARNYCNAYGMRLVSIETAEEQSRIAFFLRRMKEFYSSSFWTSGSDQALEGHWVWDSTGNAVVYTSWSVDQPYQTEGSNYLTISRSAPFNWLAENNIDANGYPVAKYFICEF